MSQEFMQRAPRTMGHSRTHVHACPVKQEARGTRFLRDTQTRILTVPRLLKGQDPFE